VKKWGHSSFPSKRGQAWLLSTLLASTLSRAADAAPDFFDDFESRVAGQVPGAPWQQATSSSGAVIVVDDQRAFSGKQAMHVLTPRGAQYRRCRSCRRQCMVE
jgi:hypothetical protein